MITTIDAAEELTETKFSLALSAFWLATKSSETASSMLGYLTNISPYSGFNHTSNYLEEILHELLFQGSQRVSGSWSFQCMLTVTRRWIGHATQHCIWRYAGGVLVYKREDLDLSEH
jgi:hypothetical protein